MEITVFIAFVTALVQTIKKMEWVDKEWLALISAIIGGVTGYIFLEDVAMGIIIGLSATGAYENLNNVGKLYKKEEELI